MNEHFSCKCYTLIHCLRSDIRLLNLLVVQLTNNSNVSTHIKVLHNKAYVIFKTEQFVSEMQIELLNIE